MVKINNIEIGNNKPFVLIAGPCVIENEQISLTTAEAILKITEKLGIHFIFKSSYRKANRTSLDSFSGLSKDKSLKILQKIKNEFNIPVLTDIHTEEEALLVADIADILQIPAFLCRQTDLLVAAGKTDRVVNIKKGQFLSPSDMQFAIKKVESTLNNQILVTERGTTFGYNNLVVDMRSIEIMKEFGYPIVMDATHSVQLPGVGGLTGGQPKFILPLSKAAISLGIGALFLEVHPEPEKALSDRASQLPLENLEDLLIEVQKIDNVVKNG